MNFTRILALANRIIRQVLRDKRTLALIFIVPIIVMTLLYLVLTGTNNVHTLALVRPTGAGSDRVNTLINSLLPGQDKLKTINIAENSVYTTLKNGNADAAIVFPANFAQLIAASQHPTVRIVLEGADPTVASAMSDTASALVHQLGVALTIAQAQQGQGGQTPSIGTTTLPFTIDAPQYLYGGPQYTFNDSIAPVFIGIFSFFFVFLLTSVAFLRERSQGTIERVMVSPLTRTELVMGYIFGFTLFALLQSLLILLFVVFALRVHYSGNLALVFLVTSIVDDRQCQPGHLSLRFRAERIPDCAIYPPCTRCTSFPVRHFLARVATTGSSATHFIHSAPYLCQRCLARSHAERK